MHFELNHSGHGVTPAQMRYVRAQLELVLTKPGPFIVRIELPAELGTIQNGLHGPVCGDDPIEDDDVVFCVRSPRDYADRCIDRPFRQVDYVHAIGELGESGFCLIETVFGGPVAPCHPDDPKCSDVDSSKHFWASHALSLPSEKDR